MFIFQYSLNWTHNRSILKVTKMICIECEKPKNWCIAPFVNREGSSGFSANTREIIARSRVRPDIETKALRL